MRQVLLVFALAVSCEIAGLLSFDLSPIAKAFEALLSLVALLFVLFLARTIRETYLQTLTLANQDVLTGLHNRRGFESIVAQELARQKRYGKAFSLAVIDLDGFKALNDSRGHLAGDSALKILAQALRENTRQTDRIARVGGDEFAILMPLTWHSDCNAACDNLSVKIARRMMEAGFAITASIGHTTFEQAPKSVSEAFQKADNAMYAAKASGKGRVVKSADS